MVVVVTVVVVVVVLTLIQLRELKLVGNSALGMSVFFFLCELSGVLSFKFSFQVIHAPLSQSRFIIAGALLQAAAAAAT